MAKSKETSHCPSKKQAPRLRVRTRMEFCAARQRPSETDESRSIHEVHCALLARGATYDEAQDGDQHAAMKWYEKPRPKVKSKKAWLIRTGWRHVVKSRLQQQKRRRREETVARWYGAVQRSVLDELLGRELDLQRLLKEVLAGFSSQHRQIVRLKCYGMTAKRIAERLAISTQTIRRRLIEVKAAALVLAGFQEAKA